MYSSDVSERLTHMGLVGLGLMHELNTPLAMAELSLELLMERFTSATPPDPAQATEALGDLLSQVRRMSALVQRLRALATGRSSPRRAVALDAIIDSAIAIARPTLATTSAVRLIRGPQVDTHQTTDPLLLEQAVIMLILNGADAAAGGPDPQVIVSAEIGAIIVRDNGPGFGDIDAATSLGESSKGTMGVGLNVVQLIISELGGTLRLGNHPSGGAVARIDLDQRAACGPNQTNAPNQTDAPRPTDPPNGQPSDQHLS